MNSKLYLALFGSAAIAFATTGMASAACIDDVAMLHAQASGTGAIGNPDAVVGVDPQPETSPNPLEAEGATATTQLDTANRETPPPDAGVMPDTPDATADAGALDVPDTSPNPSEVTQDATATVEIANMRAIGDADFDTAIAEAIAADARGDEAACLSALERARTAM